MLRLGAAKLGGRSLTGDSLCSNRDLSRTLSWASGGWRDTSDQGADALNDCDSA